MLLGACAPTAKTPPTSAATETPVAPQPATPDWRAQTDAFLQAYSIEFQRLYTQSQEAGWRSNTRIVAGNTTNAAATARANQALVAFTGSTENITRLREHKSTKTSPPAPWLIIFSR